jgi:hypothetical protein
MPFIGIAIAAHCGRRLPRLRDSVVRRSIHMTTKHRIFTTSFASVYPLYVAKAEKKGRKKSEVDAVICWLTGYGQRELEGQLKKQKDFETFFKEAPKLNPSRTLIKGVICGVRVEVSLLHLSFHRGCCICCVSVALHFLSTASQQAFDHRYLRPVFRCSTGY